MSLGSAHGQITENKANLDIFKLDKEYWRIHSNHTTPHNTTQHTTSQHNTTQHNFHSYPKPHTTSPHHTTQYNTTPLSFISQTTQHHTTFQNKITLMYLDDETCISKQQNLRFNTIKSVTYGTRARTTTQGWGIFSWFTPK